MQQISYRDGDTELTGVLARPSGRPKAAIAVFPTIMNQAPNVERRLQMLARAGYLALMIDFYGEPITDREGAMRLGNALRQDPAAFRRRIAAGLDALASHPERGTLPMAAIGYCLGGGAVLEAARMGADLAAVVSFHGLLATQLPVPASQVIRSRILVCHGDADPLVPRDHVRRFQEELEAVGANYHLHIYSGVKHGFTDPKSDASGLPALSYDASADRQSWAAMLGLFDEVFA